MRKFTVHHAYAGKTRKRLTVRLSSRLAAQIKKKADAQRITVNEWCTRMLDKNTP